MHLRGRLWVQRRAYRVVAVGVTANQHDESINGLRTRAISIHPVRIVSCIDFEHDGLTSD